MTIKNFVESLGNPGPQGEIIKNIFFCLISSICVLLLFYLFFSVDYSQYAFYLLLSILSYAFIMPSVHHVRCYGKFPSMSGMMIGMTIGMVSGFLPGLFVGATNGMFLGSVFGMTVGILLGVWNGKCCGIMGIMEGIMAGFMGGLMGAMTAVMTLTDHIKILSLIICLISSVIIIGLNYLIYTEAGNSKNKSKGASILSLIIWNIILTVLTFLIITFGPRSFLFQ